MNTWHRVSRMALLVCALSVAAVLLLSSPPPSLPTEKAAQIEIARDGVRTFEASSHIAFAEADEPPEFIDLTDKHRYIEVIDSCDPYFSGACLRVRAAPSTEAEIVGKLRTGMVLKVSEVVRGEDRNWYKVSFKDEWLRYPERVKSDWYVAEEFVRVRYNIGEQNLQKDTPTTSKRIVVDRSEQMLRAYDGKELFMETTISTGLEMTPTPLGTFTIFRKTPSRYMQGPLPYLAVQDEYDLPGVPWNLYFTKQGAVIHGAYWHDKFGDQYSHGCVNLEPSTAEKLYKWAELGTTVAVVQ